MSAQPYSYRVQRCADALAAMRQSRSRETEADLAWKLNSLSREIAAQGGAMPTMPAEVAGALRRFRNG